MAVREVRASGLACLELVTTLLHRMRLTDPEAGLWEAADLHWWWRKERRSDAIEQRFWVDGEGPVAAAILTDWGQVWQCDPIVVPGGPVSRAAAWSGALESIDSLQLDAVEVLARDDDADALELLADAGYALDEERSGNGWLDARDRGDPSPLPEPFVLVDRARPAAGPHPMRRRNGEDVEARLAQCALYDPTLDLAVETLDGQVAGYALFWFDPATGVGLVEPMRVEDAYQRRGLARALLSVGLERLAACGSLRLKVGYSTEIARHLYARAGFRVAATSSTYRWSRRAVMNRDELSERSARDS